MVQTIRLDDMRARQSNPVDLIKIDVEGHEEAVFRGGSHTLIGDQPIVLYECFHGSSPITDELGALEYLIFDAERLTLELSSANNFVAFPKRHLGALDILTSRWEREMALATR